MSENLNINGYVCTNKEMYDVLKTANLTSAELKILDKNSDNKISEDELAEFVDLEDEDAAKSKYSDNPTIASLEFQYEKEQEKISKYEGRIADLMKLKNKTRVNIAAVSKTETINSFMSKLDSIQSEIDEYNSKIATSINNMASISTAIIQVQTQLANAALNNASSGVTNTSGTAGISGASGVSSTGSTTSATLNVQNGSGTELASVTGDLSICLDRVAQSLGTSRQGAADYITTLCNTVGKGYFNPKVILSQIFSESSGIQSCSTTATSNFVGLGQMSAVAVEEVNRQFGTNFTFNDMNNAAKNLEAMVYLMTYQYERYGNNLGAALTAYNVGHYSGTVNGYAQKIMSRV